MTRYAIRNKEGHAIATVSRSIVRRMQDIYFGQYTTRNNKSIYEFREDGMFGNGDIGIAIYTGTFIELE